MTMAAALTPAEVLVVALAEVEGAARTGVALYCPRERVQTEGGRGLTAVMKIVACTVVVSTLLIVVACTMVDAAAASLWQPGKRSINGN